MLSYSLDFYTQSLKKPHCRQIVCVQLKVPRPHTSCTLALRCLFTSLRKHSFALSRCARAPGAEKEPANSVSCVLRSAAETSKAKRTWKMAVSRENIGGRQAGSAWVPATGGSGPAVATGTLRARCHKSVAKSSLIGAPQPVRDLTDSRNITANVSTGGDAAFRRGFALKFHLLSLFKGRDSFFFLK